jgi:hypothetical protein
MSDHCHDDRNIRARSDRSVATQAGIARRQRDRLGRCDEVPVEPFRARFLELYCRGDLTANGLAAHLGLVRRRRGCGSDADGTAVKRMLGLKEHRGRRRTTVPYDLAVRLADALGLDYTGCGV